jgi:hypothetical protein
MRSKRLETTGVCVLTPKTTSVTANESMAMMLTIYSRSKNALPKAGKILVMAKPRHGQRKQK